MSFEFPRFLRLTTPAKRIMLVAFCVDLAVACLSLGVQFMGIAMKAEPFLLGLLGMASSLCYTIMCVACGSLSDRWGRRKPAVIACAVSGAVWLVMLLAQNPYHLLALMPLSGAALALLWPSLQAWLGDLCGDNRRSLNRILSLFNVSWSAGLMFGPLVAGVLWDQGHYLAFVVPTLLVGFSILILYTTTLPAVQAGSATALKAAVSPEKAQLFLYLAWIGNFASWFSRGVVNSMFPKLGDELGFSHSLVGLLLFIAGLAPLIAFGIARLSHRWHYHLRVLLVAELVGMASMFLAGLVSSPGLFALAFALSGLCAGVTYVSSLMYSLEGGSQDRGKRSGLHEAVLGLGIVLGPLFGGLLGQFVTLHSPFLASGVVFVLAMGAQVLLFRRATTSRAVSRPNDVTRKPRLHRLALPAKRLIFISFAIDIGAACTLLAVQFKGIRLGAEPMTLGLLGTANFLIYVFVCIISGHLSDRLGRRFVTVLASAVCAVSWLGMAYVAQVWQLLVLAVASGAGLALIWPPIEAWLADLSGDSARLLNRNIGLFNVAWTAGLMVGPLLAGQLWQAHGDAVFTIAGGTALLCLLIALLTPTAPAAEHSVAPPDHVNSNLVRRFLYMAWLALFGLAFVRGMVGIVFPKLGDSLGFSPATVGRVLFALAAGQFVTFLITRITTRWQYKLWPLLVALLGGLLSMGVATLTNNQWVFAGCFFVAGGALGVNYMGGITYALQAGAEGRGKRVGLHESVMGAGLVTGPFFGGLVAQHLGLHAPFALAGGLMLLGLVGQLVVWLASAHLVRRG